MYFDISEDQEILIIESLKMVNLRAGTVLFTFDINNTWHPVVAFLRIHSIQ